MLCMIIVMAVYAHCNGFNPLFKFNLMFFCNRIEKINLMKRVFTLLLLFLAFTTAYTQHGFTIEYAGGGALHTIDLATATKTFVGNTANSFGAGDFGPNEVLYAINSGTNELYEIDTVNGSTTLIGAIAPPSNHMWTGMAYDDASGIMYGMSAEGTSSGIASLHIIDLLNATYSLVGSQGTATAISCIAIDDQGQMYGIEAGANGDLYQIDKDNGSVTFVGPIGVGVAGMGQGLDFCQANGTMYMTNYNSSTFENTLRTVNLSTGSTTQVGGLLGMWTGLIAIPGGIALEAGFSADITEGCIGGQVNFTDQSAGSVTSWLWTFEGGTPATSTDQNPTVTYNTTGVFDVSLEVSDGTNISTLDMPDMITVDDVPDQPNQPSGNDNVCGGEEVTYTTLSVEMADSYTWEITPSDAGTISGTDTSAVFESSTSWNGAYTVKVKASNGCGTSIWSTELSCTLNFTPSTFFLGGGGSYCQGGQGLELTLDGSETGVDYELYHEGVPTGNIIAGTGNPISFGFQTDEGLYQCFGSTSDCETLMFGEAFITISELPEQGNTPSGETVVCSGTTEEYQTTPITGADDILWVLDPTDAGIISGSGETIEIEWSETYNGVAILSVYGTNNCGDGMASDGLEITVNELPTPEVTGESDVCKDEENLYSTADNTGSTYLWNVVGGDIVAGGGTSEITVLWTTLGNGAVSVIETNTGMCDGFSDTLTVFVDECTFISDFEDTQLKVYPNPASTYIVLDLSLKAETTATIVLYNQFGQKVYYRDLEKGIKGSHRIDTQSLDSGVYFIKVVTSSGESFTSTLEIVR